MDTIGLMCVVRNEAHRIKHFLDYHTHFVDKVVICDQHSDDGTWEILTEYQKESKIPFVIYQDEQYGYSEPSKQKTADMLDTDWILYLDPDEIVEQAFMEKIKELIKNPEIDGYWLKRSNVFSVRVFGDYTPIEPKILNIIHPAEDDQLRLTRKIYSKFPETIHVRVNVTRPEGDEKLEKIDHYIIHQKTLKEQFDDDKRYQKPVEALTQTE